MNQMAQNEPLLIYLGDLTYDTVTISTESFPLNIGYISSYCQSLFNEKVNSKENGVHVHQVKEFSPKFLWAAQ